MVIAIVQPDIIWEDKSKNLEKLGRIISAIPDGTDIIILPEMFNTGFSMNPGELAEPPGSQTFEWMKRIAGERKCGICGSYIIERDNLYYNTLLFVSHEADVYSYDKRHLFSPGSEDRLFTHGQERIVFSFRGIRICPNICYDLRFPVWSRNRNDYDLLVNSANWPGSRRDVWITLLKARAIENQCYVAGANRVGIDGTGIRYSGDSMVIGPRGEIITSSRSDAECFITADININELNDFRKKFPVLKDGDIFTIGS